MLGLIDELGLDRPVLVGYDVGSRVGRVIASDAPGRDPRARGSLRRCPASASGSCTPRSSGTSRSTACRCRGADRRQRGGGAHLPGPLLGALERARLVADARALRRDRRPLRAARARSEQHRLVPLRLGRRATALTERPPARNRIPRAHHRPVAGARPAVPAGLVGPPRRVLRRLRAAPSSPASATSRRWRRRQRDRRGYGPGSAPVTSSAWPASPMSITYWPFLRPSIFARGRSRPARRSSARHPGAARRPASTSRCARSARSPGTPGTATCGGVMPPSRT